MESIKQTMRTLVFSQEYGLIVDRVIPVKFVYFLLYLVTNWPILKENGSVPTVPHTINSDVTHIQRCR